MTRAFWCEMDNDFCLQVWETPCLSCTLFRDIVAEVMHYVARYSCPCYVVIGKHKLVVDFCERGRVRATMDGWLLRSTPASRVLREW